MAPFIEKQLFCILFNVNKWSNVHEIGILLVEKKLIAGRQLYNKKITNWIMYKKVNYVPWSASCSLINFVE